ncbi:hypothetical protein HK096_007479 [Nowakowskiella sp. JEL0078]|nr:hypothetical protein HK096_007479 [Nowakowskiella sp. JEL0078]
MRQLGAERVMREPKHLNQFEQNSFILHPLTPTPAYEISQPSPCVSPVSSNPNSVVTLLSSSSPTQNTFVPPFIPAQQNPFEQNTTLHVEPQQILEAVYTSKNLRQANAEANRKHKQYLYGVLGMIAILCSVLGFVFFNNVAKKTVIASIQSANIKQSWMTSISADFNNRQFSIIGGTANVNITYKGSNITSTKPDGWRYLNKINLF